jgi:hypothetical protein
MKLMRILFLSAMVLLSTSAHAATWRFEVTDSPPDTLTYRAGLSGYIATARIEGGFSITVEPGQPADLHDVDLRLVDVVDNLDLWDDLTEGTPVQRLLPVDLESLPSLISDTEFLFGERELFPQERPAEIPVGPWAMMAVDATGNQAVVRLAARLNSLHTVDGAHVSFKPFGATIIPEPSTVALAACGLVALAAIQRRPETRLRAG